MSKTFCHLYKWKIKIDTLSNPYSYETGIWYIFQLIKIEMTKKLYQYTNEKNRILKELIKIKNCENDLYRRLMRFNHEADFKYINSDRYQKNNESMRIQIRKERKIPQ
jgi:hypothetical protein